MPNPIVAPLVLVTGGTGFVGAHCVVQLLQTGYRVRTTLRSLARRNEVIAMLKEGGVTATEELAFIQADLSSDANWDEAVQGCSYVLHVASPISVQLPKDENEMIRPAVDGTLRVLRAAKRAGVRRVVITSSFAAVGYSHNDPAATITEEDWTNPNDPGLSAYIKSKALAERAAWNFIAKEGGDLELAAVNPAGIFGPSLGPELSSAFELLKQLFDGALPAIPEISFGVVDVRDVADLHLRAMTAPEAKGQRFLALAGEAMSLFQIASLLKERCGGAAARIPSRRMPNWMIRVAALFNAQARSITPQLGVNKKASNEKARMRLGWNPRSNEEAIMATVQSLAKYGAIKLGKD